MKLKNRGISKTMEKSLTCTSSTETSQPTIHATSKRFWSRNKTLASLCLAIVCVVALLPLLAVNSNAEEVTPVALEYPENLPVPEISTFYPQWDVEVVGLGRYSTAPRPNTVYAYFTSNNPSSKTSTRASGGSESGGSSGSGYCSTTVFVFADHYTNQPLGSIDNTYKISAPLVQELSSSGVWSPYMHTSFEFSASFALVYQLDVFSTGVNDSDRYSLTNTIILDNFAGNPPYTSIDVSDIIDDARNKYTSLDFDSLVSYNLTISFLSSSFSCDYPTTSYCRVWTRRVPLQDYARYLRDIGGYLSNSELRYDYQYDLGYRTGEITGYDIGYTSGYNVGASAQFDPGWFIEGVDAFLNLRLFQFAVGETLVDFTLGTILSITLGGTALIWFLKLFAGG